LPSLRHLDLSANRLETLQGFPSLPQLRVLLLSFNRLQGLEGLPALPGAYVPLPSPDQTKHDYLTGNPQTTELRALDARDNLLGEYLPLRLGSPLEGLPLLQELSLQVTSG
jgi:Leucine-rich repeat (LRR) protein